MTEVQVDQFPDRVMSTDLLLGRMHMMQNKSHFAHVRTFLKMFDLDLFFVLHHVQQPGSYCDRYTVRVEESVHTS